MELQDQGRLEQAIAEYDEAIRLDPQNAGAYHNRGLAAIKLLKAAQGDKVVQVQDRILEALDELAAKKDWQAVVVGVIFGGLLGAAVGSIWSGFVLSGSYAIGGLLGGLGGGSFTLAMMTIWAKRALRAGLVAAIESAKEGRPEYRPREMRARESLIWRFVIQFFVMVLVITGIAALIAWLIR